MNQAVTLIEPEQRAVVGQPQAAAGNDSRALMVMIEGAMSRPDFDVDKLKALFDVKKAWEADEARKAFHAAMAEFKKNPPTILKDNRVKYAKKDGSVTEYDHATLGNIVRQITAGLSAHGVSASWKPERHDGRIFVTCSLTHRLGHSESVTLDAAADDSGGKNAIQAMASAVTYLQRYTLLAITGLAVEGQDDDARSAAAALGDVTNVALDSLLERLERTTTDADALALWHEGVKLLAATKDTEAHAEFKACVLAHRTRLKGGAR